MKNNNSHTDFRDLLVRREGRPWFFNPIKVGRFTLSIQASEYHFSEPQETGLSPKDYERWEVILFFDESWIEFRKWMFHYWGPWVQFYKSNFEMFAHMPTNVVQKLYERIKLLDKFLKFLK